VSANLRQTDTWYREEALRRADPEPQPWLRKTKTFGKRGIKSYRPRMPGLDAEATSSSRRRTLSGMSSRHDATGPDARTTRGAKPPRRLRSGPVDGLREPDLPG